MSKQTISTITDAVIEGMTAWRNRSLDSVYPVIFIDAVNVKIRDGNVAHRPIYIALAVTAEGTRDILGLWAGEHGDGEGAKYWLRVLTDIEGAKYWLRVLTDIKNRGTKDVCIVVCDGLKEIREEVQKLSLRDIQEMDFSRELLEEFINQLTGDVTQEVLEESRQEGVEDISR